MNWTGYMYPFRRYRGAGRGVSHLLRRVGRMRGARLRRHGRGCCCCPAFFLLGLAGVGLLAGFLYAGIRFLPLIL